MLHLGRHQPAAGTFMPLAFDICTLSVLFFFQEYVFRCYDYCHSIVYVYPAMHGTYGFVYKADDCSSTGIGSGSEFVVETNDGYGKNTLVYKLGTDVHNVMNGFHVNIATDAKPYRTPINCFNELRASRDLDGPRQNGPPLTYTVNGIAFNDGGDGEIQKEKYTRDKLIVVNGKKVHDRNVFLNHAKQ